MVSFKSNNFLDKFIVEQLDIQSQLVKDAKEFFLGKKKSLIGGKYFKCKSKQNTLHFYKWENDEFILVIEKNKEETNPDFFCLCEPLEITHNNKNYAKMCLDLIYAIKDKFEIEINIDEEKFASFLE